MKKRQICFYLHAHQPWRVRHYSIFDINNNHLYFNDESQNKDTNNKFIIEKVAEKSYRPMNKLLLKLAEQNPEFQFSLSITGTLIEQLQAWAPDVLDQFKKLVDTGQVEILAETYHHSLAFFYSKAEFEIQVELHSQLIEKVFGYKPTSFRNTELAYNNDLAYWADQAGYKAIIAEGWDPLLQWRSPNFVYQPSFTESIRLLLKNYKLSDDIAFRFSNQEWEAWPLTADTYTHWIDEIPADQPLVNLFMDYETFGEHQWEATGIFSFFESFVNNWLSREDCGFSTITQAAADFEPVGYIDVPHTTTWADTDRDLSAWLGNSMQHELVKQLYDVEQEIHKVNDKDLMADWRKLQTSDHLYYLSTKWFNDGDVHAYFSPYSSPYEAYINISNALHDLRSRLLEKGAVL